MLSNIETDSVSVSVDTDASTKGDDSDTSSFDHKTIKLFIAPHLGCRTDRGRHSLNVHGTDVQTGPLTDARAAQP